MNATGLSHRLATVEDAATIAALESSAGETLTQQFGRGHWSLKVTERGVLRAIATSRVLIAVDGDEIVATLRLATKKPWAIDSSYFTSVDKPVYLQNMAVRPDRQRHGVGGYLLETASAVARDLGATAIRLDAYNADAGAGDFYRKCGYREVGRATYRATPLIYFELLL